MENSALKYRLAPYGEAMLGKGAYSIVYRATEEGSGRSVALKKSRVSRTVRRPILQQEVRVLQLLKGHPAIPAVYGYGQLVHFEYIAMELLGPSVAGKKKDGAAVMVKTAIRFVTQALAALQHVHSLGLVHCDIKPDNFLCVIDDPSTIKLADFGISKLFSLDVPVQPECSLLKDRRRIVGSLYWASLNSHNGQDLSPRDDIESLALTALFLLRGHLPWIPRPHLESLLHSQEVVRIMKSMCSGLDLSADFPCEFGKLLAYSRALAYNQLPDYEMLRATFVGLASKMGCSLIDGPLDWAPCYPHVTSPILEEPTVSIPDEDRDWDEDDDDDDDDDPDEDSYFGWDIDIWDRQGERSKELTLPTELEAKLDGAIPLIWKVESG